MLIKDQITKFEISISLKKSIPKNKIASKNKIKKTTIENQRNFPIMKSLLFIGLLRIKKIVFHSISLKSNWLPINKTQISQKTSIVAKPKSIIILLASQIVISDKINEKRIKTIQKNIITYKNLFLIISLNVFNAIFNIKILKKFKNYNLKNLYFNLKNFLYQLNFSLQV